MTTTPDYAELISALTSYQQADEDGVMVVVSRQACDEAATGFRTLLERNAALERERDDWESRFWRRDEQADKAYLRAEAAEAKLAEAMKELKSIEEKSAQTAYGSNHIICYTCAEIIEQVRKFLKENGNGE